MKARTFRNLLNSGALVDIMCTKKKNRNRGLIYNNTIAFCVSIIPLINTNSIMYILFLYKKCEIHINKTFT